MRVVFVLRSAEIFPVFLRFVLPYFNFYLNEFSSRIEILITRVWIGGEFDSEPSRDVRTLALAASYIDISTRLGGRPELPLWRLWPASLFFLALRFGRQCIGARIFGQ